MFSPGTRVLATTILIITTIIMITMIIIIIIIIVIMIMIVVIINTHAEKCLNINYYYLIINNIAFHLNISLVVLIGYS